MKLGRELEKSSLLQQRLSVISYVFGSLEVIKLCFGLITQKRGLLERTIIDLNFFQNLKVKGEV